MDFSYYIVRKKDMVILDGASDMVGAINTAQSQGCACLILQACIITEMGQDLSEAEETESVKPEVEVLELDESEGGN